MLDGVALQHYPGPDSAYPTPPGVRIQVFEAPRNGIPNCRSLRSAVVFSLGDTPVMLKADYSWL